ncbi:hypothetical protein GCM10023191_025940 [Actinoallomurus oryzae]|uniref:Uncharacterized protein n=1 Tax=Actinoallomurus oryzae TaxID=502180 RepID=A0ABP8PRK2_9ACTN
MKGQSVIFHFRIGAIAAALTLSAGSVVPAPSASAAVGLALDGLKCLVDQHICFASGTVNATRPGHTENLTTTVAPANGGADIGSGSVQQAGNGGNEKFTTAIKTTPAAPITAGERIKITATDVETSGPRQIDKATTSRNMTCQAHKDHTITCA